MQLKRINKFYKANPILVDLAPNIRETCSVSRVNHASVIRYYLHLLHVEVSIVTFTYIRRCTFVFRVVNLSWNDQVLMLMALN